MDINLFSNSMDGLGDVNRANLFLCKYTFFFFIFVKILNAISMENDTRWIQRYSNFHKACGRLVALTDDRSIDDLSELEVEGLVQRFEYTFELAWKVLQDLLSFGGFQFMPGPNGVIKTAFESGYITDHEGWRAMLKSRNVFTHVYDESEILATVRLIYSEFAPLLKTLDDKLEVLSHNPDYQ